MKKSSLLLGATLIAAASGSFAQVGHAHVDNFIDQFDVTLQGNIAPLIKNTGHTSSTIVDDGSLNCSNTACTFKITDHGQGGNGNVMYTIGDKANNKPYCDLTIADGAFWPPQATLNASCGNGASASSMNHNPGTYEYNFTISAPTKK